MGRWGRGAWERQIVAASLETCDVSDIRRERADAEG